MAEKIRASVESLALGHEDSSSGYVTLSIGVAVLTPGTGVTASEIIRRSDEALYQAKEAGRNRVVCWDPAVTTGTMIDRELSAHPASRDSAAR